LVARAGGDHNNPKAHDPPRVRVDVSDSLLQQIPQVAEMMLSLEELKRRKAGCKTFEQCKDLRIFTCMGTNELVLHDIRCFFKGLASRLVDPDTGIVDPESPTLLSKLGNCGALAELMLYLRPVFESREFQQIKTKIRKAEDEQSAHTAAMMTNNTVQAQNQAVFLHLNSGLRDCSQGLRECTEHLNALRSSRADSHNTLSGSAAAGPHNVVNVSYRR